MMPPTNCFMILPQHERPSCISLSLSCLVCNYSKQKFVLTMYLLNSVRSNNAGVYINLDFIECKSFSSFYFNKKGYLYKNAYLHK